MKKTLFTALVIALSITSLSTGISFAETTSTKISGKVLELNLAPIDGNHPEGGVYIKVKTKSREWMVHVGPKWIQGNRSGGIQQGDDVMIIGTTFRFGKSEEIKARDIKKLR